MDKEKFVITEFKNIFEAEDPKGRKTIFKNRYAATFIITLRGSIAFSYDGGCVIADIEHPVFLPRGLDYENECLEDAYSLGFSFYTLEKYNRPESLAPIPQSLAMKSYDAIKRAMLIQFPEKNQLIMSELYVLSYRLFLTSDSGSAKNKILKKAVEYMTANLGDPDLKVGAIANYCYISEIYLRKLFEKEQKTTPYRALCDLRMTRARELLREKRPIKEIAVLVGYSDIYQFSRAYKKYFGHPPSDTV